MAEQNHRDRDNENNARGKSAGEERKGSLWPVFSAAMVALILSMVYMAVVYLVILPNFEKNVVRHSKALPDPLTPRLNFIAVEYDGGLQRAKTNVIDFARCASTTSLLFLWLTQI